MGYNIFGRRADGASGPIAVGDDGSLAIGDLPAVEIASDDNAQHGVYTLDATPLAVTTITIPSWATIIVLSEPSHRVNWRVDGNPAAPGVNALTDGGNVPAAGRSAIKLRPGAATLRLNSSTALATVRVEIRGTP